jgi:hypothetical protein
MVSLKRLNSDDWRAVLTARTADRLPAFRAGGHVRCRPVVPKHIACTREIRRPARAGSRIDEHLGSLYYVLRPLRLLLIGRRRNLE